MKTIGIQRTYPTQYRRISSQTVDSNVTRIVAGRCRTDNDFVECHTMSIVVGSFECQLIGSSRRRKSNSIGCPSFRLIDKFTDFYPTCRSRCAIIHPQSIHIAGALQLCMRENHNGLEGFRNIEHRCHQSGNKVLCLRCLIAQSNMIVTLLSTCGIRRLSSFFHHPRLLIRRNIFLTPISRNSPTLKTFVQNIEILFVCEYSYRQ